MPEETTTTESSPETQEAPQLVAPREDPLLQALWKDLGRVEGDEKDISPAPVTDSASSGNSEPAELEGGNQDALSQDSSSAKALDGDEGDSNQADEKSKFSIRHQPMVTEDTVKNAVREAVAESMPTSTESVTPPEDEQKDPEEGLLEEQREELELARIAEKSYPDKYKGLANSLLSYYEKLEAYATTAIGDDPDRSFGEDDDQYQDWVSRNRPKFSENDRERAERTLIENRAYERAKTEVSSQYTELERRQKALEMKPQIDSRIESFGKSILSSSEVDAAKAIIKSGFDGAAEEFPLESSVYKDTINQAKNLAGEYLGFVHGLKEFDYNNSQHKWLLEFINHNGEWFEKNGGQSRTKDGKSFVSRARYSELHAAGKANDHWTFDHEDILDLLGANALHEANHHIESTNDTAKKYGFVRPAQGNSASRENQEAHMTDQHEDIQPMSPTISNPSVGPGNADSDTSSSVRMGNDVLQTLGMK